MNPRKISLILSLGLLSAVAILMLVEFIKEAPGEPDTVLAKTPQPTAQTTPSAPEPAVQLTTTYASPVIAYPTLPPNHSLNPTQVAERELNYFLDHYFNKEPGTVIAEGNNATPVPDTSWLMYSYQVAEIELPRTITRTHLVPVSGRLQPRLVTYNKVWRLSITGVFPIGNSSYEMFLNDTPIGYGVTRGNQDIVTIVFDPTLLQEGARVGLSWGAGPAKYLPETLHFTQQPSP